MTSKVKLMVFGLGWVLLGLFSACDHQPAPNPEAENEIMAGGNQTVFTSSGKAFGISFKNLDNARQELHNTGDRLFNSTFVTAPAILNPGLGPIFNSTGCFGCHSSDGRGKAPEAGEQLEALLLRISIPGKDEHGGPMPVPGLGLQLQDKAIFGFRPEANTSVDYLNEVRNFINGDTIGLRKPVFTITNPIVPSPGNMLVSARLARPVHGLGLLESVTEADILALSDPNDANNDGISGKPNRVWDIKSQSVKLGRFGWKAESPTLLQQTALAFSEDIGISNFLFPDANSEKKQNDISDSLLYAQAFYVQSLSVPARRNANNPDVLAGKSLFMQAGCNGCHVPKFKTGSNLTLPQAGNQVIFPYSDMLLHDMGPDLADNRPAYEASGSEWRTPPLWGLGLNRVVNGNVNYLHDGRARSIMEAIMWHGGEAEKARKKVEGFSVGKRGQLIRFLESL